MTIRFISGKIYCTYKIATNDRFSCSMSRCFNHVCGDVGILWLKHMKLRISFISHNNDISIYLTACGILARLSCNSVVNPVNDHVIKNRVVWCGWHHTSVRHTWLIGCDVQYTWFHGVRAYLPNIHFRWHTHQHHRWS